MVPSPEFASALFECDDSTSLRLPTGARLIRKLPGDRSLGYLHKLHAPITTEGLDQLQFALGRRLPVQYRDFLLWANGGELFDNTIYLYGYVEALTRGIRLEDQTAISILSLNQELAGTRRQEGWMRVGSAVGWDSKLDLQVHVDGSCAVIAEKGLYVASSFDKCLSLLISRIGACFSCGGINDDSYAEVEAALGSIIRPQ